MAPSLPITFAVALTALLYCRGWFAAREAFPNAISARRLGAFLAGLMAVWAATGSPLAHLDHELLTAHMAQHLVLMTIAAPLILVGAPVVALLHAVPSRAISGFLRSGRMRAAQP